MGHPRAEFRPHSRLAADGAAYSNAVAVTVPVQAFGASKLKSRIKTSGAGTLKARYVRPPVADEAPGSLAEYEENQPADVAVTGGTETEIIVADLHGEAFVKLEFLPSADGTFTYWDCSLL